MARALKEVALFPFFPLQKKQSEWAGDGHPLLCRNTLTQRGFFTFQRCGCVWRPGVWVTAPDSTDPSFEPFGCKCELPINGVSQRLVIPVRNLQERRAVNRQFPAGDQKAESQRTSQERRASAQTHQSAISPVWTHTFIYPAVWSGEKEFELFTEVMSRKCCSLPDRTGRTNSEVRYLL